MKKKLLSVFATGLMICGMADMAKATIVNLDPSAWNVYQNTPYYTGTEYSPRVGPTYQATSDGLQFNGSGYRAGTGVFSVYSGDFSQSTVNIKWMANGGDGYYWGTPTNPSFMSMGLGLAWDSGDGTTFEGGFGSSGFSTNHTSGGTTLINDNTWYYTTLTITPDKLFTESTSTGNYLNAGGTFVHSTSYTIADNAWAHIGNAHILAGLADNYGGANARMTLGEVQYNTAPTPEPATMLLIGTGFTVFIGVRRRKSGLFNPVDCNNRPIRN